MELYLKTNLTIREVADKIASRILVGFVVQARDGLNLGGGDYFLFERDRTEVILVSNDTDHADVFVSSRQTFPYYCYVCRGSQDILERMLDALPSIGLEGELGNDA